jgi:hypothetical protein
VPPSRRPQPAAPPLTDDDVTLLRARVAAGERPRVVVRAASAAVAAGTRGNVVRLGDPKQSEYIVVRLGKDEVPFAPAELGLTTRPKATAPAKPATRGTAAPKPPARPAAASRTGRAAARPGKQRKIPPLVVTLRFRDGGWSVEAQRGARRLAKPCALRPGAVSAFAEHIEDDRVRLALIETVESCRSVVEERAAGLRAELEAAEAALRAYDSRPARGTR